MARIIHLTVRSEEALPRYVAAVSRVARRLLPDNLPPSEPVIVQGPRTVLAIVGPGDCLHVRGTNVGAGFLVEPQSTWDRPGNLRPDGAYALFRSDTDAVEIVSDSVASRTVWYALTDDLFVASTSQRAIVALLGGFEFNPEVVTWMIASGTLGPGHSWDRRIRCLEGASVVRLDRGTWRLQQRSEPVVFRALDVTSEEHERRTLQALRNAVTAAQVADPRWAITLSGGVDSRLILTLLRATRGLRAVTWGTRSSPADETSDAAIAARLAAHFGIEHIYFPTDLPRGSAEDVLERFVRNGEGRVDRISGYADGFSLWQSMVRTGVRGIVRGDEAFGCKLVRSDADVRAETGMQAWSDHPDLPAPQALDLTPQEWPDFTRPRPGESRETWRDRLYQQYRVPFLLASLSDLKLGYVEVINPLLCDSVIGVTRQLPDVLRNDKELLCRIAQGLSPAIPFARTNSIETPDQLLRSAQVVEYLLSALSSADLRYLLPETLIKDVLGGLMAAPARGSANLVRHFGDRIRRWRRRFVPVSRRGATRPMRLDGNRRAFRAYILARMQRMLHSDAHVLPR